MNEQDSDAEKGIRIKIIIIIKRGGGNMGRPRKRWFSYILEKHKQTGKRQQLCKMEKPVKLETCCPLTHLKQK